MKNPANDKWKEALQMLKDTTKVLTEEDMIKYWDDVEFISISGKKYNSLAEYDSYKKPFLLLTEMDGYKKSFRERT